MHSHDLGGLDAIVTDFDGVLTDNMVYVSESGGETVRCSRADGIAFDYIKSISIPVCILSTEKNTVVAARAKKLNIECLQGVKNKVAALRDLADSRGWSLERVLYVANDLNDLGVIGLAGVTVCPSDSHPLVIENTDIVLRTRGGEGVFREILEEHFKVNLAEKYLKEL